MPRFVLLAAVALVAAFAHAEDPLQAELKACERFCQTQNKASLGLQATRFGETYGRACVCQEAQELPAAQGAAGAPPSAMRGAAADRGMGQAKSRGQAARREVLPSDAALLAEIIDCERPEVKACATRSPLYMVPDEGLAERLPKSGRFDVTIIEVSDFQCPFCARVQGTLKALSEGKYGSRIRFAFMHNPLNFHQRAMPAALAAEAARRQGKFWPMHDKLFANYRDLSDANFRLWADELGLDRTRFEADLADPGLKGLIRSQQAAVLGLGARGTPAFFINGRLLSGAQPLEAFEREVRLALGDALRVRQRQSMHGFVGNEAHQLRPAYKTMPAGKRSRHIYRQLVSSGRTEPAKKKAAKRAGRPKPPDFAKVQAGPDAIRGFGRWPAKVVIVEYSDFECRFCQRAANTMAEVHKAYGDDVYLIYRHLPLGFHKQAEPAARAAEAAGLQGQFWPMHDKLFSRQKQLNQANFELWAGELGLNMKAFKKAMASNEVIAKVKADAAEAGSHGVRGTPNFFVNGKAVRGAQPFSKFKIIIDAEIARADALLKKGVSRQKLYEALLER